MSSRIKGNDSNSDVTRFLTDEGKPIVQIAFYSPVEDRTATCIFTNSLAACWTGNGVENFSHCEIRFSNKKACSVTDETVDKETGERYGGIVHYTERSLARDGYQFVEFAVTLEQERSMKKMAKSLAKAKVPFNKAAMLLNFIAPIKWIPIDREGRAYFCSELVTALVQKAGYLKHLNPCTTSPTALWVELRKLEDVCDGYNVGHKIVTYEMLNLPMQTSGTTKKKKKRMTSKINLKINDGQYRPSKISMQGKKTRIKKII